MQERGTPLAAGITIAPVAESDREGIIDIFNYYIGHGFAAFPEQAVPYGFFGFFLEACKDYPSVVLRDPAGRVLGFGLLHAHNPMPVFRHTAEVSYFIRPELTGKGLGSRILAQLEREGNRQGITTILASISSLNDGSIRFHEQHGFIERGRFIGVGVKNGISFDTVWMQKDI